MTSPVIKRLVDEYGGLGLTLADSRFLTITLLCFAGFLRIDELLCAKLVTLTITSSHWQSSYPKARTTNSDWDI